MVNSQSSGGVSIERQLQQAINDDFDALIRQLEVRRAKLLKNCGDLCQAATPQVSDNENAHKKIRDCMMALERARLPFPNVDKTIVPKHLAFMHIEERIDRARECMSQPSQCDYVPLKHIAGGELNMLPGNVSFIHRKQLNVYDMFVYRIVKLSLCIWFSLLYETTDMK
jgi:hypothetical protein